MDDSSSQSEALYSLVSGDGDGFMLGVAAGDAAGGAWELGYSAVTEQATVISYLLIEHHHLDPRELVRALREMDGSEDGEAVYRSETPHFRAWLDRAAAGSPVPEEEPSLDGVIRAVPIGVAFRRDPSAVTRETLAMGRIFDRHSKSLAAGVMSAAAVAASCFGQSGADLIAGVADTVLPLVDTISAGALDPESLESLEEVLGSMVGAVGLRDGSQALGLVGGDLTDPLHLMMAGILLAAPISERHHTPIEQAARIGGSTLGAAVGAIVGARVGIRAWPWAFANDTWFAEIGRRVSRGPDEVRDLPIPYAVEQHLINGSLPGHR
jgi:ADP-ribosylglycohydrolase